MGHCEWKNSFSLFCRLQILTEILTKLSSPFWDVMAAVACFIIKSYLSPFHNLDQYCFIRCHCNYPKNRATTTFCLNFDFSKSCWYSMDMCNTPENLFSSFTDTLLVSFKIPQTFHPRRNALVPVPLHSRWNFSDNTSESKFSLGNNSTIQFILWHLKSSVTTALIYSNFFPFLFPFYHTELNKSMYLRFSSDVSSSLP